ncbi:glucosamine-6-phosphate deaminase [Clostridium sp. cel8]|jgi:glucosamine-6-phosphate deaminase|uniref:glucosamine-6-phosphate deaminase n=1 Tax=unclassified Clostridium TaxID=2614128 RepID=UPI0015F6BFEF|nr:glucosamine-6-phosphate deaminase [Clostridium sp. cel8]MBA5851205.1 glucosamine-6-phosphate deaminase [Clostridium sp. cel8]
MKLLIAKDYEEMSEIAAEILKKTVNEKPDAVLGLATGSTPVGMYKKLIEMNKNKEIDFSNVKTVNLDEYVGLDPEDQHSYRYFMNENLFNHINIDKSNTFFPNGMAENLEDEAKNYDNKIEQLCGIDIQVLGIGSNGHIGFNEPDDFLIKNTHVTNLTESTRQANSRFFNSIEDVPKKALTMGIGQIMKAKKILLLVKGENKIKAVNELLNGNITTKNPSTLLQLHNNVTVIIDRKMADKINANIEM